MEQPAAAVRSPSFHGLAPHRDLKYFGTPFFIVDFTRKNWQNMPPAAISGL